MFPPEEQSVIRLRLADTLQAVISQRLLPRADGNGRAAALEILMCTGTVAAVGTLGIPGFAMV
ncbi:MAG: type IV pilus twitching motility protein PilT, partial [Acidobacteria bacterium]|nr:type IV pilus twitching motility protein PilT [Acidobacteriota bacterium]